MDVLKGIALVVLVIGLAAFAFGERWFAREIAQNELHEAPSVQQIRWDVRHIRQDLHALVMMNAVLVIVVVGTALLRD